MGVVATITGEKFPKQSNKIGRRVFVCYHYNTKRHEGVIVRDDVEEPFVTIFKLDDSLYVLATECQYSY